MSEVADKFPQDQFLIREVGREVVLYARLVGVERELVRRPAWQGGTRLKDTEANIARAVLAARPDLGLPFARIFQRVR